MKQIILFIIFTFSTLGCASSHYLIDRNNDASDIFTATVGLGAGAKVRAGVINIGLPVCISSDIAGLKGGSILFSNHYGSYGGELWLLFLGGDIFDLNRNSGQDLRNKSYTHVIFSPDGPRFKGGAERYTQLDILLGLGLTFHFGFNPGELLDFILGWANIDIYDDDIEQLKNP